MNYRAALEKARSTLGELPAETVASRAGAGYVDGTFVLDFFGRAVRFRDGVFDPPLDEAGQVLFLHYLTGASGRPLSGELVTIREFPGGDLYWPAYQKRVIHPFLRRFATDPAAFSRAIRELGGVPGQRGTVSGILRVLPRVPLQVVLWAGDDEVPASATVLYDRSAGSYLPTEDLIELAARTVRTLIR